MVGAVSVVAVKAVLNIRSKALTTGERFVLLCFAEHARQPDAESNPLEAWPTAGRIADETGMSREHVQRSIKRLIELGLIAKTGQRKGRSDVILLSLRRVVALAKADEGVTSDTDSVMSGHHNGVMSHQEGVMSAVQGVILDASGGVIEAHTEREVRTITPEQSARDESSDDFAEFWAAWPSHPRKRGRVTVQALWSKLTPAQRQATMRTLASDKASRQWTRDNGEFIPGPIPWLRRGPWDVDTPAPKIGRIGGDPWATPADGRFITEGASA